MTTDLLRGLGGTAGGLLTRRLGHRVIGVEGVHVILLGVEVAEDDEEDDTAQEGGDSQTDEHPQDGRVEGSGGQGLGEGGAEGVGEEVHGLDEGLHGGRGLGVGILEAGDRGEDLGDTDEHVGRGLDGDVHVVTVGGAVDDGGVAEGLAVAGAGGVDQVLDDGGVHHGEGGDDEAQGDTGDGAEGDLQTAHDRVDDRLEQGDEDDDGDRVKVLHQIVGDAVAVHLAGLGDKVTGELAVDDPVDRVEGEDAAGDEGTLQLVNEVVVPGQGDLRTGVLALPGGLGGVHVAVLDHHPESLEGVGDNGALRRAHDVVLATNNEHQGTGGEHAKTEQVGGPETNVLLHVWSSQQGERSQVDTAVEDHVDALNGQRRVDDDALSLLGSLESHLLPLVLIGDQRSNVTLDTTGTETDDQDCHDETTQTSTVLQSGGNRSADQNQETNEIDTTEQDNSLVLAEVLISDNGTNDGSNWIRSKSASDIPFTSDSLISNVP